MGCEKVENQALGPPLGNPGVFLKCTSELWFSLLLESDGFRSVKDSLDLILPLLCSLFII